MISSISTNCVVKFLHWHLLVHGYFKARNPCIIFDFSVPLNKICRLQTGAAYHNWLSIYDKQYTQNVIQSEFWLKDKVSNNISPCESDDYLS